jgi:hypothetical protein
MQNIPQNSEIGYTPIPTVMFPLPTRKMSRCEREYNGLKCTYFSKDILPYTAIDRIWLEAVTTHAIRTKDPYMPLGRVSEELAKIGKSRQGHNIAASKKGLQRVYGLNVSLEQEKVIGGNEHRLDGVQFPIGQEIHLTWIGGRTDNESQLYLPGANYIELSGPFMDFLKKYGAVPHIREDYHQMSAKEQDLYRWLIVKLHGLTKPLELSRAQIGAQFWPHSKNPRMEWKRFKERLYKVRSTYYPFAKVELTDEGEGLRFRPSPPLIEPDDRRAGFLP